MSEPVREWVTFDDPREEGRRWEIDVTFLTSHWRCIFGDGCQGVLSEPAPELVQGCCSHGAHFSDAKDRDRVVRAAKQLRPEEWQLRDLGRSRGVVAKVGPREWRTRVHDGACVFLNRVGFEAGPGCALHLLAERTGRHFVETKPEVCWQLPLRREDRVEGDGSVTSVLGEFDRSGWGEGGDDFAWWCTEAPEAFTHPEPVYTSLEPELRKMLGDELYASVVSYLEARAADRAPVVRHPTEVPVQLGRRRGRR